MTLTTNQLKVIGGIVIVLAAMAIHLWVDVPWVSHVALMAAGFLFGSANGKTS